LSFDPTAMEAKVIVRKDAVTRHGLEEELFRLSKIIHDEATTWVLIPAGNLSELMRTLEAHRISYGIESEQEFTRERLR
jgi:hypothetical protein